MKTPSDFVLAQLPARQLPGYRYWRRTSCHASSFDCRTEVNFRRRRGIDGTQIGHVSDKPGLFRAGDPISWLAATACSRMPG